MKNWIIALLIVLIASLLIFANVLSAPDADYSLSSFSLEGGVFNWHTGGSYQVGGSFGQHEAGLVTGSEYQLGGGLWPGGEPSTTAYLYLPLMQR